jgi:hypothetical protein
MLLQVSAIVLSVIILIGWVYQTILNRKETMFEFKFDESQDVSQMVISIKSRKITNVYLKHPDETWDQVLATAPSED